MEPGQLIADRYVVRGMLGKGGLGEVYLADDQRLQTQVALKRVPLALSVEPSIREALVSEARILARPCHTHIVRLFDLAYTVDGLFLVLEFVCPNLDELLAAATSSRWPKSCAFSTTSPKASPWPTIRVSSTAN